MELIITYSIKASLAMALFYCLHMLLFRNETFFKLRRVYFLFALAFSLFFPFISLEWTANEASTLPTGAYFLSEIEVFVDGQMQGDGANKEVYAFTIFHIIVGIIIAGSVFLCGRFVIQLSSLLLRLRGARVEERDGCKIIEVDDKSASSFSFFRWIIIDCTMQPNSQLQDIIDHEKVHAYQLHSIDVLLYEVFCVLFWWNPFAWMMREEMKLNLEYLADSAVVQAKEDCKAYQYTLLKISTAKTGMAFINNFNVLHLKKRITMMNKKRSSIAKSAKFLFAVPLALALLLGNVVYATPSVVENINVVESNNTAEILQVPEKKERRAFEMVEKMPTYPGGLEAMMKFVGENLKYPELAHKAGAQGRIVVRFVVEADGSISDVIAYERSNISMSDNEVIVVAYGSEEQDVTVTKEDATKLMKDEAIRVVKAMPKWNAGMQDDKSVSVYYSLPIMFKLKK